MRRGLRRQLPAYSPVSVSGMSAALLGAAREPAGLRAHVAAELCRTYGAREALLVGSGTTALRLALAAVRATVADRVIALPAYSCYDVATAADGAEAAAWLYDLDPSTLGPEPSSFERALEQRPAAVVVAHLYGYPVAVDRITRQCGELGIPLIEDAAQAAGARLGVASAGSFGSLTVLSFGRGKGMTAGAGGALLARDEAGLQAIAWAKTRLPAPGRGVRDAMVLAAQWTLGRPAWYWLPAALPLLRLGATVYHAPQIPTALTSAALRALAVGLRSGDVEREVEQRRATATRLLARARRSSRLRIIEPATGAQPGFLRLPLLAEGIGVADLVAALGHHGVAGGYPALLGSLRPFRDRVANPLDDFSGARTLAERLFTVPTHSLLTDHDLQALETWIG